MHRSAEDEVFTTDVFESAMGGPMTTIEMDFEADTQDYSMSTVSKAPPCAAFGSRGEHERTALMRPKDRPMANNIPLA
jgi:hypothetical protein